MSSKIDYSKRDYAQLLEVIKKFIANETEGKWSEFFDSDIGFAQVKTFAALTDYMMYYLDRQAAESYLDTCELRESAVSLAKPLGYSPTFVTSSRGTIRLTFSSSFDKNIEFPQGTLFYIEKIPFIVDKSYVLPAGKKVLDINLIQGNYYSSNFVSRGIPFEKISIPKNIDYSSFSVMVNGEVWRRVNSFVYDRSEKIYKVSENKSSFIIQFGGDSWNYPPENSIISVVGVTSLGSKGNFSTKNLDAYISTVILSPNGDNIMKYISISIISPPSGGTDLEPIESIKENAPAYYTTQNRAVTSSDYLAILKTVPDVGLANVWGGEEVNDYGRVYISFLDKYNKEPTEAMIDNIKNILREKAPVGMSLFVSPVNLIYINSFVKVFHFPYFNVTDIKNNVNIALSNIIEKIDIGRTFKVSEVISELVKIEGVDYVNFDYDVYSFGKIENGIMVFDFPENIDINSIKIYNTRTNNLIFDYKRDKNNKLFRFGFEKTIARLQFYDESSDTLIREINMDVRLAFKSKEIDLYLGRNQKSAVGNVNIEMYQTGNVK
jgi:hypothetical protein